MRVKPRCRECGRLYLEGRDGNCEICLAATVRRKRVKPLRCLCGKIAVEIIIGGVLNPEGEPMDVEIAPVPGMLDPGAGAGS